MILLKNLRKKFKKREKDKKIKKERNRVKKLTKKLFSLKIVKIVSTTFLILIALPLLIYFVFKPKPPKNIVFGTTFSKKYATQLGLDWKKSYIKVLDGLKVKNLRLIAYWNDIESKKDTYDFSDIKWQLEEAEKRNVQVIMTIGRKVPRYPECFEPSWWSTIEDDSIRQLELLEYLKESVNNLKGYRAIKMWQVENEPFWPFGECKYGFEYEDFKDEINLVRSLDNRYIITQDSGEGGTWHKTYKLGDYLGISMYRKIWYNFWKIFAGKFIYFKYPLPYWTYPIKAGIVRVPHTKIVVTELQGEPWGPKINSQLSNEEKNKSMSKKDFLNTVSYAQKAGFKEIYLWGVEWWLWEKENNNNPFYWNVAKALFD